MSLGAPAALLLHKNCGSHRQAVKFARGKITKKKQFEGKIKKGMPRVQQTAALFRTRVRLLPEIVLTVVDWSDHSLTKRRRRRAHTARSLVVNRLSRAEISTSIEATHAVPPRDHRSTTYPHTRRMSVNESAVRTASVILRKSSSKPAATVAAFLFCLHVQTREQCASQLHVMRR